MRKRLKFTVVLFFLVVSTSIMAQQGLQMEGLMPDSAKVELEKQALYRQLLAGESAPLFFTETLQLPDFDINTAFANRYRINPAIFPENNFVVLDNFSLSNFTFSPVQMHGTVISSAAHQLGDKLIIGGISYGANAILPAAMPNRGMNGYDFQGNTLFMQYKVSKNFKIETRVNVNNGPGF